MLGQHTDAAAFDQPDIVRRLFPLEQGLGLVDLDADLRELLLVMDALRFRTGDGVVASDDAAALGAVLGGLAWRRRPL